jgi:hypothetical protein
MKENWERRNKKTNGREKQWKEIKGEIKRRNKKEREQ